MKLVVIDRLNHTAEKKPWKNRIDDMFSGWHFKQQRALLWHVNYLSPPPPPLSLSYTQRSYSVVSLTHNWHSLSANSCPLQIGSIICSVGLHEYMHVEIWSGSITFRAVQHLNTLINTHPHRRMYTDEAGESDEMTMVRWVDGRRRAGEEDYFPFFSQWSGNSVRVWDLIACLFSPRPVERWRDSPLIQDAQFSGPK